VQETSLLELFESALGRPCQSGRLSGKRLPPEPGLDLDEWPIKVAEPAPLEPATPAGEPEAPPALRARVVTPGLLVSLGLHVMPFAALVAWSNLAPEIPAPPIPVQLVVEQQPPPPAREEKAPPSGPLASEDSGKKAAPLDQPIAQPTPPPPPLAEPPPVQPEIKLADAPPPPKPKPKPKPKVETAAVDPTPKPAPPSPPPPRPPARAPQSLDSLFSDAMKDTGIPGPGTTRDEYLAYLVALTKQHIDLLPRTFVGNRRGETVLAVLVLDDGTIARIAVRQSSGYPDIDQRIEQMIAAVGRFPPLPQQFQTSSMDFTMRMRFPEALDQ
jgi:TonB family protein